MNTADIDGQADCTMCGPTAALNWRNTPRILEHMGAHILYDTKLNASEERCGLCLRPAPMCQIYIKKGRGTQGRCSVDQKKSKCPNFVRFNYRNAETSSESSPCSNVPVICPLCPTGSPAVWTYSLQPISESATGLLLSLTFHLASNYLSLRKMVCNAFGRLVSSSPKLIAQRKSGSKMCLSWFLRHIAPGFQSTQSKLPILKSSIN